MTGSVCRPSRGEFSLAPSCTSLHCAVSYPIASQRVNLAKWVHSLFSPECWPAVESVKRIYYRGKEITNGSDLSIYKLRTERFPQRENSDGWSGCRRITPRSFQYDSSGGEKVQLNGGLRVHNRCFQAKKYPCIESGSRIWVAKGAQIHKSNPRVICNVLTRKQKPLCVAKNCKILTFWRGHGPGLCLPPSPSPTHTASATSSVNSVQLKVSNATESCTVRSWVVKLSKQIHGRCDMKSRRWMSGAAAQVPLAALRWGRERLLRAGSGERSKFWTAYTLVRPFSPRWLNVLGLFTIC